MAFHAAGVGIDRSRVGGGDLGGSMARRAVGRGRMVIVVARDAGMGSWPRLERDRRGVALRARELPVSRVLEYNRTWPGRMIGNGDLDRQRASGIQLA